MGNEVHRRAQNVMESYQVKKILPESIFKLPLHGLHVRVLHQEGGAQLAELGKLDFAGTILVNFEKKFLELILCGSEAHGPHDLAEVISREEINFLCVKQVKAGLEGNIFKNIFIKIFICLLKACTMCIISDT